MIHNIRPVERATQPARSAAASPVRARAFGDTGPAPVPRHSLASLPLFPAGSVVQCRWNKVRGTEGQYYWDGRGLPAGPPPRNGVAVANPHSPLIDNVDRIGTAPRPPGGGFLLKGGRSREVYHHGRLVHSHGPPIDRNEPTDTSSYFDDSLQIVHQGPGIEPQQHGAPLPVREGARTAVSPYTDPAWLQTGERPSTPRGQERTIMGGSAADAAAAADLYLGPRTPWAHIRPDHSNPPDREDPQLRHIATEGANQRHTALETGVGRFIANNGPHVITRELRDPIVPGANVYSTMSMGIRLQAGAATRHVVHNQPFFSAAGGRHGDPQAITGFLEAKQAELRRERGRQRAELPREHGGPSGRARKHTVRAPRPY